MFLPVYPRIEKIMETTTTDKTYSVTIKFFLDFRCDDVDGFIKIVESNEFLEERVFSHGSLKIHSNMGYRSAILCMRSITPGFAGFRGVGIPKPSIPGIGDSNISLFSRSLSSSKIRL